MLINNVKKSFITKIFIIILIIYLIIRLPFVEKYLLFWSVNNKCYPLTKLMLVINNKILVDNGNNYSGFNIIVSAATNNDMKALEILLNYKNNSLNRIDRSGGTPITYAVQSKSYEAVDYLITKGADVNIKLWQMPLAFAIEMNDKKMVELLLAHKAIFYGIEGDTLDKYMKKNKVNDEIILLLKQHNSEKLFSDQFR